MNSVDVKRVPEGYAVSCVVRNLPAAMRAVDALLAVNEAAFEPVPTAYDAHPFNPERRTMRLIRELDAPIDLARYARAANAYIHFHNVMAETRKWYRDDVVLAEREDVLSLCNTTIDAKFDKTPPALRAALLDCI